MNGNNHFELFFVNLDEKMTSSGYKRGRNKKQNETVGKPIIYSNFSPRAVDEHAKVKNIVFLDN